MNNLEFMLADNPGALPKIIGESEGIACSSCPAYDYCHSEKSAEIEGCLQTRAAWLLQVARMVDNWEQIEADAKKSMYEYFGCASSFCANCPAKFSDGSTPMEYYGVSDCHKAKACDLVDRCKQLMLEGVL